MFVRPAPQRQTTEWCEAMVILKVHKSEHLKLYEHLQSVYLTEVQCCLLQRSRSVVSCCMYNVVSHHTRCLDYTVQYCTLLWTVDHVIIDLTNFHYSPGANVQGSDESPAFIFSSTIFVNFCQWKNALRNIQYRNILIKTIHFYSLQFTVLFYISKYYKWHHIISIKRYLLNNKLYTSSEYKYPQ